MPTYVKPKNVSYTDMAIYIDKHIYSGNYDANLVYEYIYLIIYVLACKAKYFTKYEDYDDFALYMSSRVYMRLIDKRQFEDIPGEKKLDKIKSSLNFIKHLLYPMKVDFQKENHTTLLNPDYDEGLDSNKLYDNTTESIKQDYRYGLSDDIITIINELPSIIKNEIKDSPYKDDTIVSKNLYYSCLLSLLSNVTLNNYNKDRLARREEKNINNESIINKMYDEERRSDTILWHLPDSMSTYIKVLCNKIRKVLAHKISETTQAYEVDDDTLQNIMDTAYEANGIIANED